jgi:hypothetical protein
MVSILRAKPRQAAALDDFVAIHHFTSHHSPLVAADE